MSKIRLAVFVSGGGTNLQAIIDAIESGFLDAKVELVLSTRENAYALERARNHSIPYVVCSPKDYENEIEFSNAIHEIIAPLHIDLIALAGFMSILSGEFIAVYKNKIMNTHPSLLPSFGGKGLYGEKVHKAVLNYGAKVSGATIMFVTQEVDKGPIIFQKAVEVSSDETVDTLSKKVLALEHELYPLAIKYFAEDRLKVDGRVVKLIS
jgi:phosphoribosylglycinamide formyltransferase-1